MKKFLLFALLFSSAFASEIKIATYNVENLFDGKEASSKYDDYKVCAIGCPWNEKQYQDKLQRTSKVIKDIDADIIALQEIENLEVTKALAKKNGYKYYFFAKPKGSSVGNAFLSKFPFKAKRYYPVYGTRTRDIVRVDLELNKEIISLFNVHLPANRNSPSTKQKAILALKEALKDGKNNIILGDFNSEYQQNFILEDLLKNGTFVSLWDFLNKDKYSHVSRRAIDNVLVEKTFFAKNSKIEYKKGSFEVFKKAYMFDEKGNLKKLNQKMFLYSDHFPLLFSLLIK